MPEDIDRQTLVRLAGITKNFGAITVLKDVRFEVAAGEVHVLAGENGAGKSTLVKILAGIHTDFEGRMEYGGREIRPRNPLEAGALGVAVIHQELSLIGSMSVADNLFLGRTPTKAGFVQDAKQEEAAQKWVRQLGFAGIDALPQEGVTYVHQGILDATFQYPAGGKEAIDIALKILHGQPAPKEITLPTRLFDKNNVDQGGEELN
jgi:ABC-type sugar transport system ATPase subunit